MPRYKGFKVGIFRISPIITDDSSLRLAYMPLCLICKALAYICIFKNANEHYVGNRRTASVVDHTDHTPSTVERLEILPI